MAREGVALKRYQNPEINCHNDFSLSDLSRRNFPLQDNRRINGAYLAVSKHALCSMRLRRMRLPSVLFASLRILSSSRSSSGTSRSFNLWTPRCAHRLIVRGGESSSSSSLTMATEKEDATAYNAYFSAAVDLSNAHVSDSGLLTRTSGWVCLYSFEIDCCSHRIARINPHITHYPRLPQNSFTHCLHGTVLECLMFSTFFTSDSLGPGH